MKLVGKFLDESGPISEEMWEKLKRFNTRSSIISVQNQISVNGFTSVAQAEGVARIIEERNRQDQKWGVQHNSNERWTVILGEEFGEVCRDIFEKAPTKKMRAEITQCAAVCLAWLEDLDRAYDFTLDGKPYDLSPNDNLAASYRPRNVGFETNLEEETLLRSAARVEDLDSSVEVCQDEHIYRTDADYLKNPVYVYAEEAEPPICPRGNPRCFVPTPNETYAAKSKAFGG